MKKLFALFMAFAMVVPVFAQRSRGTKVGVAMPTQSLQRWNQDGQNVRAQLEAAGYTVDLQYANNDIATQVSQIENMITGGCNVLVIASIDGTALSNALNGARRRRIPVIAYDRLIMNTRAVSYYATFDNYKVGQTQGNYIAEHLDLANRTPDNPAYIELFTGPTDDNNCVYFFGGAMDVLRPYLESGVLVCRSGQTTQAQCSTINWDTEQAQNRMENLIASQGYGPRGTRLDAVLSSNDSVANGITNALVGAGYTSSNIPIITGQDCDITSVKNMVRGLQAMSVFKDTRTLADRTVLMVDALLRGTEPEINDTTSYNNGTGIIPTYLCEPVFADTSNYREILIDSGYYTEEQLQ